MAWQSQKTQFHRPKSARRLGDFQWFIVRYIVDLWTLVLKLVSVGLDTFHVTVQGNTMSKFEFEFVLALLSTICIMIGM